MPRDTALGRLYELAETQDGYFSTMQAARYGVAPNAVLKASLRGRLERISRAVYRLVRYPVTSSSAHLWEAVLWPQVKEPIEGVLSHETALTLHGLSDANPAVVHITVPKKFRLRRESPTWLHAHRADLIESEITRVEGLPVTTAARALHDLAQAGNTAILHDAIRDAIRKGIDVPSDLL